MKQIELNINGNGTCDDWFDGFKKIELLQDGVLTDNSKIQGTLTTPIAPPKKTAAIKKKFPDFNVEVDDTLVQFEDKEVCKVLAENLGSGEPLSKEQWNNISSLGYWFGGNTKIEYFDEFKDSKITNIGGNPPTNIANTAFFRNCTNLKTLSVDNIINTPDNTNGLITNTKIEVLNFESLQSYKCWYNPVISGNTLLKKVFLPKLTAIGNRSSYSRYSFIDGGCFEFAALPSVQKITAGIFTNNSNLKCLDFGENLHEIELVGAYGKSKVFIGCTSLNTIVIRSKDVPEIDDVSCLDLNNKLVIYVPSESLDNYKAAENWNVYVDKLMAIGGTEWIAEFGSADRFADIDKYVTDTEEAQRVKQSYIDVEMEDYQKVEYLESTGTLFIKTNILVNDENVIKSKFLTTIQDGTLCGGLTTKWPVNSFGLRRARILWLTKMCDITVSLNEIHNIEFGPYYAYFDGKACTVVDDSNTTGDYLGIFYSTYNGFMKGRIYNFELVGKLNLIPCYRKSDNKPGMYDTVSGQFFTNSGTGEFTVGQAV